MPILIPNIGAGTDKISQKTDIMIIWLSFEMMYYKSWIGSGTIFLTWSDSNYCSQREEFWKRRRKKVQLSFSVCQTFRNLSLAQGFQNPFMDVTKHCSFSVGLISSFMALFWPTQLFHPSSWLSERWHIFLGFLWHLFTLFYLSHLNFTLCQSMLTFGRMCGNWRKQEIEWLGLDSPRWHLIFHCHTHAGG